MSLDTLAAIEQAGFKDAVQVASDGVEALDYLFRRGAFADRSPGNPAVVLLGLRPQELDGFEILKAVRADPSTVHVPVAALTSSLTEEADRTRAFILGANAYVEKPENLAELSSAIRRIAVFWLGMNLAPG